MLIFFFCLAFLSFLLMVSAITMKAKIKAKNPKANILLAFLISGVLFIIGAGGFYLDWNSPQRLEAYNKRLEIQAEKERNIKAAKEKARIEKEAADEKERIEKQLAQKKEDEECAKDTMCLAKLKRFDAEERCSSRIEQQAKYDFKWTDGIFGRKFPSYFIADPTLKHAMFEGDSLKLQNGFGAWSNYVYRCNYDLINDRVIKVILYQGKFSH